MEEADSTVHADTIDMEEDSDSTNSIELEEESDSIIHPNTINRVEETDFMKESPLSKALQGISFSCSGSLKVDAEWEKKQGNFDFLLDPPSAPPVTIRWDDEGYIGKIQFPLQDHETSKLDQLIEHGGPATFGHLGNDVLDESYRKATKVDSSQFSSNFHPHDHGILDAISQTLLPTVTELTPPDKTHHSENWGLLAELYKLNIYSAPSGRFKAHVDTPRGPRQWGSLVVCLPVSHYGMSQLSYLLFRSFSHSSIYFHHLLNREYASILPNTNSAISCFHHANFVPTFVLSLRSLEIKIVIKPCPN